MKRKSKLAKSYIIDDRHFGDEPKITEESSNSDLICAYNYYNYFYDSDQAKSFVIEYFKGKKHKATDKTIKKINKIVSHKLTNIGWNCKILSNGGVLTEHIAERTWNKLDQLLKEVTPVKEETSSEIVPVVSIKERIEEKASSLIADLEDQIDIFIRKEDNTNFDAPVWFREKAISPQVAKIIIDYYQPLYAELVDTVKGDDLELKSAYKHWTKPKLKKYLAFIKSIIAAGDVQTVVVKATRKQEEKEKSASVLVKKLKFKIKDEHYGINSASATDIIGTNQLWLFDCKTRYLSVFNSIGTVGLSIKGFTVTGFDEKTSIMKKLRKPEDILKTVTSGGKVVIKNLMSTIKSKENLAKPRLNNNVLILRTVK